jgi:hypothetical protein
MAVEQNDLDLLDAYRVKLDVQLATIPIYHPQERMIVHLASIMIQHLVLGFQGKDPPDPMSIKNVL